jgi:hypothetical protein
MNETFTNRWKAEEEKSPFIHRNVSNAKNNKQQTTNTYSEGRSAAVKSYKIMMTKRLKNNRLCGRKGLQAEATRPRIYPYECRHTTDRAINTYDINTSFCRTHGKYYPCLTCNIPVWLYLHGQTTIRAGSGRCAVRGCVHAGGQFLSAAVAWKLFWKSFIRGENWRFEGKFLICRGKIRLDLD